MVVFNGLVKICFPLRGAADNNQGLSTAEFKYPYLKFKFYAYFPGGNNRIFNKR